VAPKPQTAGPRSGAPATQVFRQFAWNLAGTLAQTGKDSKPRPQRRSKPAAAR
jgi:hypothetical protein